jgi:DNA polymerase-3 subunit epsilon
VQQVSRLKLDRPIVFFDLETTGVDPKTDRIVEVSILRVEADGNRDSKTRRVNPERPIPAGASAVHGIFDADVADAPTFRQIAKGLAEMLEGADLSGFNVARFDIPLLDREFRACDIDMGVAERRVVDVMSIFHRMERRDLSAATRFYLNKEHVGAHSAEADVEVTLDILEAQLERYEELPTEVGELDAWIRQLPANAADSGGKFVREGDQLLFNFGKNKGKSVRDIAASSRGYLEWILGTDFPEDAKQIVRDALAQK